MERCGLPLQAILTAELTDNDGWRLLINLSDTLGYTEMVNDFQVALENEECHLTNARGWLSEKVLEKAQAAHAKPTQARHGTSWG